MARNAYRLYASLRGWYWGVAKLVVVVAMLAFAAPGLAKLVLAVAIVDAYVKRAVRDGTPLAWMGLGREGSVRHTLAGCVVGGVLVTAVIVTFWTFGWYRAQGITHGSIEGGPAQALVVFPIAALVEEVAWRGFLFRFMERRAGSAVALIVSSLVFGLAHVANEGVGVVGAMAIALGGGLLLAGAYMLTRTLWFPIGIHWSWNLFAGPMLGEPEPGQKTDVLARAATHGPEPWTAGGFGPEAGLVALVVGTLAGAALVAAAIARKHWAPRGGVKGARISDPDLAPSAAE